MGAIIEFTFRQKQGATLIFNTIFVVAIALVVNRITNIDGKIIIISATILSGIQLVWNIFIIKVFKNELIIKRPLIPFGFGTKRFDIKEIELIIFQRNRKGLMLTIKSRENSTSFLIDSKKEEIANQCIKLNEIGLTTINDS